jgi:hypothetical protein
MFAQLHRQFNELKITQEAIFKTNPAQRRG